MKKIRVLAVFCALAIAATASMTAALSTATVSAVTAEVGPDASWYDGSVPYREFELTVTELRMKTGQTYDIYAKGLTEADAPYVTCGSEDYQTASIQYVGPTSKGLHFQVIAQNTDDPREVSEGAYTPLTTVWIAHKGNEVQSCTVAVYPEDTLALSHDQVALTGAPGGVSTYDFFILGTHDENTKVTVEDPSVCSVELVDANHERGLQYRVTAKPTGSRAEQGLMGTKITYLQVEQNGQTEDLRVMVYPIGGSLMLDTINYTMPTRGGMYDIGLTIKDGDGNKLSPQEVQWLLDTGRLQVKDSRNGSIVDLQVLDNGNFRVTSKNPGTAYIEFAYTGGQEINVARASIRIDVVDDAAPGGSSTRDTTYWAMQPGLSPVRYMASRQYYRDVNGWDTAMVERDICNIADQLGMQYDTSLRVQDARELPYDVTLYGQSAGTAEDLDYAKYGLATKTDKDAYDMQTACFVHILEKADMMRNIRSEKAESLLHYRPVFLSDTYPSPDHDYIYFLAEVMNP